MNIIVILVVEIMNQLKLDDHGKPGSAGRPFRPIVGLLSSAHPRPGLTRFEPTTYQFRARALNLYGRLAAIDS